MNERAPQFRDMKNDEDTLIVFVLRLVQLCQKRYRWSSPVNTTSIELEEGKAVSLSTIRFGIPDSDELVSHLAVVRQFWLQSEPINHSNVTSILLNIARLRADVETRERIKALRQSFKREFYAGSFKFVQGDTSVELSSEELVNFWLNTFYFHTDFDHLRAARVIIGSDFTRRFRPPTIHVAPELFSSVRESLGTRSAGGPMDRDSPRRQSPFSAPGEHARRNQIDTHTKQRFLSISMFCADRSIAPVSALQPFEFPAHPRLHRSDPRVPDAKKRPLPKGCKT